MDNLVRLATKDEIEEMADHSDLQFAQFVYALGPARAVFRLAPELDPVTYADLSMNQKRMFILTLEAHMRLNGLAAYYFNVPATEEYAYYRDIVEKWGAVRTGDNAEFRYKKVLQ